MGTVMAADSLVVDAGGLAERERVLGILRAHEAELRGRGVTRLRLFGSVARGEAGQGSDVDLLAEIDHASGFSLLDLVGLQYDLEDLIGRKVEIATAVESMRPGIRRRLEADAIEVF
jgi:predicted nucleotidyltransferase